MCDMALQQGVNITTLLYSIFVDAASWTAVISEHPNVAQALGDLYHHLTTFDVFVMSNGAMDADAYLLHIARLAGVTTRVVNLGAIAGGYMSPHFSGASTFISPSHFVAYHPTIQRGARGLPVKICHPVMDAARVIKAARSCRSSGRQTLEGSREARADACASSEIVDGAIADADHGDFLPARFVMVGRVSTMKTPSVFIRAIATLQRRWERGRGGERQTEGVVVGKGHLLEPMEGLARDLNASIRFTGFLSVDAVPCEVMQATALVLPSTSLETFGMVAPEAMLLGVPVVTFGFGGSGELVRHMENGILVAEPTPRALANALESLARSPGLRDRLGEQARRDAVRALSLPEIVACHADEFIPTTAKYQRTRTAV